MIDLLLYLSRLFVLINHGEALQIQASKYDLFNKTYPLLGQNCRNKRNHIYLTNKQKCIEIQTKSNQCTSSFFILTQFRFIQILCMDQIVYYQKVQCTIWIGNWYECLFIHDFEFQPTFDNRSMVILRYWNPFSRRWIFCEEKIFLNQENLTESFFWNIIHFQARCHRQFQLPERGASGPIFCGPNLLQDCTHVDSDQLNMIFQKFNFFVLSNNINKMEIFKLNRVLHIFSLTCLIPQKMC